MSDVVAAAEEEVWIRPGGTRRARHVVRLVLVATIVSLGVLGTIGEVARLRFGRSLLGFVRLFGLGQEANVPTWYSSATLLAAALLAAAAALLNHQRRNPIARQWACLGVALGLMSLDETAAIHETISYAVAQRLVHAEPGWQVHYAWILPGTLIAALLFWWFVPLWRHLAPKVRRQFTISAAVYFGGVLGVELAEAACVAIMGLERANGSAIYTCLWTTQELMEMSGVAALILALMDYLAIDRVGLVVRSGVTDDAARTPAAA